MTQPPPRPAPLRRSSQSPLSQEDSPVPPSSSRPSKPSEENDEEDDYLTMSFDAPSTTTTNIKKHESSLARRTRLAKTAQQRAYNAPKAVLERQAKEAREQALNTSLLTPVENGRGAAGKGDTQGTTPASGPLSTTPPAGAGSGSKGLAMMAKLGFTPGDKLGAKGSDRGLAEPIGLEIKEGRAGLGADEDRKRKLRAEWGARREEEERKRRRMDEEEGGFRERVAREREEKRCEGLWWGAMKVLEGFEDGGDDDGEDGDVNVDGDEVDNEGVSGVKPRKRTTRRRRKIGLLYRPLINAREDEEREKRARNGAMMRATTTGIGSLDPDEEEDADDRLALGTVVQEVDDAEADEDGEEGGSRGTDEGEAELDKYMAESAKARLGLVVMELRVKWRYCFWCKARYDGDEMDDLDGCPGVEEEDHD